MTDPNHIAEARKKVSRPQIREAFLRNGAVIPADRDDLPDYVYESVFELLEMAAAAVQGEPVAWSGWGCQYPGKMPRLYGDRRIAELNCDTESGDQVLYFTAAPQPAEQQPDCASQSVKSDSQATLPADSESQELDVATQILNLILYECRYWHGRDEARRGGYAILYAKAKDLISKQKPAPDVEALVDALEWIRGAINCTPDNDAERCGAWISTKHPMINKIDLLVAAHRKQQEGEA